MSMVDAGRVSSVREAVEGTLPSDKLKSMSQPELRRLKAQVEALLPSTTLSDLDMPKELMEQFRLVKDLQSDVLNDSEIPLNQRSQLAGQVASTLQQLIKMQSEFYTAERFRAIENMVIAYMKRMPLEDAQAFLDEYEKLGGANG